ncbi:MAG: hypothetical protein NTV34_18345 [Proteobacteria bacterium]|nr:hypothetical protein [Pseudomonadota bacterium]
MQRCFDSPVNFADFAEALQQRQLAVWHGPTGRWSPIPVGANPIVISQSTWSGLVSDARQVLNSFPTVLRWLQCLEQQGLWRALYSRLTGVEFWAAGQAPEDTWGHSTLRFDLFWDSDQLKIIEANCTIPAMQAYSDIVLESWQQATGTLLLPMRSNSLDLWTSLKALYFKNGGLNARPTVLILHRAGDSQLAEIEYHQQAWSCEAEVVCATPESCVVTDTGIMVGGKSIDLVYRHVFGWRLEAFPLWIQALKSNSTFQVYNPVSAHYEAKGFFAVLSEIAADENLSRTVGLLAEQRDAVNKRVPWTRIVPSRKNETDRRLLGLDEDAICMSIEDYVLKNSLGYGGHQVFIGSEWSNPETQLKLQRTVGKAQTVSPREFWRWMTQEAPDTWIIQKRMSGRRYQSKILTSRGEVSEVDGFADASVFLNSGTDNFCGGGVSRFASGPIVNIGGGGGLVPFIID